ncbi:MAG: hypothetical protein J07HQX50_02806 [Haloquadratum sp. J07HQX50]|nr:MAG: hypothetical protein J07HQX50_02806 [Haloquadratum sp. J07HQX50]
MSHAIARGGVHVVSEVLGFGSVDLSSIVRQHVLKSAVEFIDTSRATSRHRRKVA